MFNRIKKSLFLLLIIQASSLSGLESASDFLKNDFGIPEIECEKISKLRNKYLTTHRQWLSDILDNSVSYRIFVREKLKERNMPSYLEYLPLIESDYNPKAVSSSKACGMWQFMLNSVAPNLKCDDYVDERFDPWKSTDAALIKLQDNYRTFGNWLLAITAYNCGAGAMAKAMKNGKSRDFWYLSENGFLSEQSSQYVPKLLAIADIAENTEYYGIELPTARNEDGSSFVSSENDFEYIKVKESVNIKSLAIQMRIDEEQLLKLNLALTKGITPPDSEYDIRIPYGTKEIARLSLIKMGHLPLN